MLIRKITMVRALGVLLLRGINDAVLLHQHDVVAEQQPHEREQAGMRGNFQEGRIVDQRTPGGESIANLLELFAAEFLSLTAKHLVKARGQISSVACGEYARKHGVAGDSNSLGMCGQIVGRDLLLVDTVAS